MQGFDVTKVRLCIAMWGNAWVHFPMGHVHIVGARTRLLNRTTRLLPHVHSEGGSHCRKDGLPCFACPRDGHFGK